MTMPSYPEVGDVVKVKSHVARRYRWMRGMIGVVTEKVSMINYYEYTITLADGQRLIFYGNELAKL